MTFRSFEKINGHGIDQGKVPRCPPILRRLKLCNCELGIWQPRDVAHVVGSEFVYSFVGVCADGSPVM